MGPKEEGKLKHCHYSQCGVVFEPATHNQIYHTAECCRLATNERIMERYYEKKEKRAGKKRECLDCDTVLSRYNDDDRCASCTRDRKPDNGLSALLSNVVAWD